MSNTDIEPLSKPCQKNIVNIIQVERHIAPLEIQVLCLMADFIRLIQTPFS